LSAEKAGFYGKKTTSVGVQTAEVSRSRRMVIELSENWTLSEIGGYGYSGLRAVGAGRALVYDEGSGAATVKHLRKRLCDCM
jgi:hypothetical protein